MSKLQPSRGIVKPLIIIGIIAVMLIVWVIFGALQKLVFLNSDPSLVKKIEEPSSIKVAEPKINGLELLEQAGLRASANIDWSMLYGNTEAERLKVSAAILEASQSYGVNANLIRAIIMAESVFNQKAISKKGARGLMQLMPGTALEVGVLDLQDPRENILGGAAYISGLLQEFDGDLKLSLAAYNAGAQTIRNSNRSIPAKVLPYVNRVMSYYRFFGGSQPLS